MLGPVYLFTGGPGKRFVTSEVLPGEGLVSGVGLGEERHLKSFGRI
jgi:hypothetical protein